MLKDELPDDLLEFLESDRRLKYDASACEIGVFTFRAADEIEEITLTVSAEDEESACVIRALDLLKSCDAYDPRGMLVYIPSMRKYGSYDSEKRSLITYRGMSWSAFLADPARYINAEWSADTEIAEETFSESGADRIVEVCSAAHGTEAGFLRSVLEEKGIRAEIVGTSLRTAAGWLPLGEATAPRIWVREGDVGRAHELVEEWINGQHESSSPDTKARDAEDVAFACQECGENVTAAGSRRGQVETCPHCGAYRSTETGSVGAFRTHATCPK